MLAKLLEIRVDTNRVDLSSIEFSKGLVAYREGHFLQATEWEQKVLSRAGADPQRDVEAYMVLAMAWQQLNRGVEAQAALANGLRVADRDLPKAENGDLGDGWCDWIVAHVLMREAADVVSDRGH
jgi:uncharacterized protein HemY